MEKELIYQRCVHIKKIKDAIPENWRFEASHSMEVSISVNFCNDCLKIYESGDNVETHEFNEE